MKATLDVSGRIIDIGGYLIKSGDFSLDFVPGNPLPAP